MTGRSEPVLFVDDEAVWRGGQDSLRDLMMGLAGQGIAPVLAARAGGELADRVVRETDWPVHGWRAASEFSPVAIAFFRKLMRRYRPRIVCYNTPRPIISGLLGARWAGVTAIHLYTRRVDFPLGRNVFSRWKYHRGIDCFVAISTAIARRLADYGIAPQRIFVVHPGIGLPEFDAVAPARDNLPPRKGLVFFCMSALTPEKGHHVLLAAFAQHLRRYDSSALWLAGDGRCEVELRQLAASLDISPAVHFLGFRPDVLGVLKAADALVMPSLDEGFGRAVLYAMAAGKAVLASRVGGLPDQVSDRENGLLVPPGDADALAGGLDCLAAHPELVAAMGQAGRRRVAASFTRECTAEKYIRIFRQVFQESGTSGTDDG
ncbi:MAG: glycosyltransferase [Acidobacteria bacterium]|nr:glycosyltransferase [Acidobacteriota bacterium]